MKGHNKIEVKITSDCGGFPITETYTIERDNTYEGLDDWVDVFKKILYLVGFHPDTIREAFNEEEEV